VRSFEENREFDLLVKVLKIFEKDEFNLELRIKDTSNELWFITIPKLKYGSIKEGEIIRIRSVKVNIASK
jgi:exosome complex RNA-binding protein Rrp4